MFVGRSKLLSLGFQTDDNVMYVLKGIRKTMTIWLDAKGNAVKHEGVDTDRNGNMLLYWRG